ncbi:hypothetical protein [Sphingomonas sp. TDK1]|uniref:hypothetical protein n=1 Tax=Sphingomonas sp. TDK1 TaxID=453247 RepID=UPI0007D95EBD|nr:hypothetical protein [Sphingomonas sp. TDK1]OAN57218.1 hypothetical protein A7X12_08350 [Sphingomonas sp. TDK1]
MADQRTSDAPFAPPAGATASLRLGSGVAMEARISTSGLLGVAAIVSAALLGSAAIVLAARRSRAAAPPDAR